MILIKIIYKEKNEVEYSKISQSSLPNQIQGEEGCMFFSEIANPHAVIIQYRDGHQERIPAEFCENNLIYEIRRFIRAIMQGEGVAEFQQVSLESMRLMDEARRQMNIRFPADERIL